jgi:hypothetical protein
METVKAHPGDFRLLWRVAILYVPAFRAMQVYVGRCKQLCHRCESLKYNGVNMAVLFFDDKEHVED